MSCSQRRYRFGAIAAAMLGVASSPTYANTTSGPSEPNPSAPLYDRLPDEVKERGHLVSATTGRYAPYSFQTEDGSGLQGLSIDLADEMSKVLGVPIRNEIAESVASTITGITSGRYDFIFGVIADTAERQQSVDMVDWTKQSTAFLVAEGNPTGIDGIASTCGLRVAVQKASFAEPVLRQQSDICVKNGDPAVDIQILPNQAAMALAIKSGRIDASFASNAALRYFINADENSGFEVVGAGDNLMGDLWQASVTPKDSEMTQLVLEAWQMLFESGAYESVMSKWGIADNMIDEPGINMAE